MAKRNSNTLFYFALGLLVVSTAIFLFNLNNLNPITGEALGSINFTIESLTSINFTTNMINWSVGSVTPGQSIARLNTAAGSVTNGNWTANSAGLVLVNIGNQNVTLDLKTTKNASQLVKGNTVGDYNYNVTVAEAGSCVATNGSRTMGASSNYTLGLFANVNKTSPGTRVCEVFVYNDNRDSIRIDIALNISSTSATTGHVTDVITVTATAI